MGGVRQVIRRGGLALALALLGSAARADTTTERSGSILIFPKVVYDADRDTFIQITNTSNSMVHLHCFYVNAVGFCRRSQATVCNVNDDCGPAGPCESIWQEVDFDIWLTKQQPTHWVAGFGRFSDPTDEVCRVDFDRPERNNNDCYGAGLDPGRIPPVSDPFRGELKCIEVDPSGAPISGNHLKGEATIQTVNGDTSRYNAVAVLGLDSNNGDTTLCLGGQVSEGCPSGAEYNACPDTLLVNHFAEGADSPLFGPESTVETELTLVPCAENFETQEPTRVTVQFAITNEFEETFSASTTVVCWGNFFLNQVNLIFDVSRLGTRVVQTRVRSSTGSQSGLAGVVEEYHQIEDSTSRVALNVHQDRDRESTDLVVIPEGP
jgi:hypothetical protein